jgi:hypothetical protein
MSQQWLVRTAKNLISGPYPKEKIQEMVASGELLPQDEVCEAHNFWISLHDRKEVLQYLGIAIPKEDDAEPSDGATAKIVSETSPRFQGRVDVKGSSLSSKVESRLSFWSQWLGQVYPKLLVGLAVGYLLVRVLKLFGSK